MCGIAGFWHPGGTGEDAGAIVQRMTDAIRHRGPDADGSWIDHEAGVALGHRRLSILDLSSCGAQPMLSPSGRYVMTYNGEFYNWRELRDEETRHGATWRGHSDTEVFLTLCDRVGIAEAVKRSAGMFALAIWDRKEQALTLVRDRIGEKPLYYGWCNGTLLFGSELKALRAHPRWCGSVDRGAVTLFLRHNYVPGPYSIYQNIRKLVPGTLITITASVREPEALRYWSLDEVAMRGSAAPLACSVQEADEALDRLLRRVISQQMVADVPLGAFLSGGIDSSLVTAIMQAESSRPVRTFTIGFHEAAFDEAHFARAVAQHLGTEHTDWYVTPQDALDVVPALPTMFDEPFGDASQVPTHLVAAMARRHVTVALSGDGGDEAFGGYNRYFLAPRVWQALRRAPRPLRRASARAVWAVSPAGWDRLLAPLPMVRRRGINGDRLHKVAGLFGLEAARDVYRHLVSQWHEPGAIVVDGVEPHTALTDTSRPRYPDLVADMMAADFLSYLPDDILVKVDRASMAVSLETRAPFVHHEVIEFAWSLPPHYRIGGGRGKLPLRRLLERYVPSGLIERPKQGFGVPIAEWLRGPLREWAESLLAEATLEQDGILRAAPVRELWRAHLSGRRNWEYRLWPVLMYQAWRADQDRIG